MAPPSDWRPYTEAGTCDPNPTACPTFDYSLVTQQPATAPTDSSGKYIQTDGNVDIWGKENFTMGDSKGLTHMQIALIIMLFLLIAGTGGFLLMRHMKK